MNKLMIGLFVCIHLGLQAQTRNLKVSVYFNTDQATLRKDAKQTLDRLVDSLKGLEVKRIVTSGNTDSDADSAYNQALSERRTTAVINYLLSQKVAKELFVKSSFGEQKPITTNDSEPGKQRNRRVDIVVVYVLPPKKTVVPVAKIDTVVQVVAQKRVESPDPCKKDTTIVLKSGIQLVFNRCEYLDKVACLEIQEIADPESAMNAGLSTDNSRVVSMASCGMIQFGTKAGAGAGCDFDCFKTAVKVRFPVPDKTCMPCASSRGPMLYDANNQGSWEASKENLKRVKIDGVEYYQYEMKCPFGKKNCDCVVPQKKIQIKTRARYKIVSLQLSKDCPFTVSNFQIKKHRKHVTKKRGVPCYMGDAQVHAVLVNRAGDTIRVEGITLKELQPRKFFPRCKSEEKEKWLLVFKRRPGVLYRKYKLKI
jgi:hypothetical protein